MQSARDKGLVDFAKYDLVKPLKITGWQIFR